MTVPGVWHSASGAASTSRMAERSELRAEGTGLMAKGTGIDRIIAG